MHAAALAIVLMVNGMQIDLPGPALKMGDYTFVPARAVLEYLGWEVQWDEPAQRVLVSRGRPPVYVLRKDVPELALAGSAPGEGITPLPVAPREINHLLYVPTRAVALITGARAAWDEKTWTVHLTARPSGEPIGASIGQMVSDPPAWAGRVVRLRGEMQGWHADPFYPATSQGPPVSRSDWVLREASGSLYCTGSAAQPDEPQVRPLSDRGRRVEVSGVVMLADNGLPYLEVTEIKPLRGLEGLTCHLSSDRHSYARGSTMTLTLEVKNPTPEALTLYFRTGQTYDFKIADLEGKEIWLWSRGKMFTMALQERTLQPGEGYQVVEAWKIPEDLRPGLYRAHAWLNNEVQAYPLTFQVTEGD